MQTGKRYAPFEFSKWTFSDTGWLPLLSAIPMALYYLGHPRYK